MINISEVKDNIKIGLKKGYNQNLLLLSSYNNFIDQVREYLLTVNVAQQLLDWNVHHDFKIQIEYPVLNFYNNAFIASDWLVSSIFDMSLIERQRGHSPTEKYHQKIDIAITHEQSGNLATRDERTIVGIELKGINKRQEEIIKDAERMSNAMLRTDPISSNSIEFCICGFLRRIDKGAEMVTKKIIQTKTNTLQLQWSQICVDLQTTYPSLKFKTEIFEVMTVALEDIAYIHGQMDSDYSEVANDTGIVVGCILSITR